MAGGYSVNSWLIVIHKIGKTLNNWNLTPIV